MSKSLLKDIIQSAGVSIMSIFDGLRVQEVDFTVNQDGGRVFRANDIKINARRPFSSNESPLDVKFITGDRKIKISFTDELSQYAIMEGSAQVSEVDENG